MGEYITKDEIIDWIWKQKRLSKPYTVSVISNNIPPADVAPVVHGEWEYIGTDKMGNVFRCSNCANRIGLDKETDYYSNCGAKMDEGKQNEM